MQTSHQVQMKLEMTWLSLEYYPTTVLLIITSKEIARVQLGVCIQSRSKCPKELKRQWPVHKDTTTNYMVQSHDKTQYHTELEKRYTRSWVVYHEIATYSISTWVRRDLGVVDCVGARFGVVVVGILSIGIITEIWIMNNKGVITSGKSTVVRKLISK